MTVAPMWPVTSSPPGAVAVRLVRCRTGHPIPDEHDVGVRRLPRQKVTDPVHGPERPGGVQLDELVREAAREGTILIAP